LTPPARDSISAVIATYQRPDACERAVRSALAQSEPPLEVLVCDDGSADDTESRMREWERRDERVRYLRAPVNSGTPATTRNLGVAQARGELVAFLDDDDEWLSDKLAVQQTAMASTNADLISTNALRSDGSVYFPGAASTWRPTRSDLLRANPIVMSSVLARRESLLNAGGFPTAARLRGLEDYAMWLELARCGASFLVLGETLVRYEDGSDARFSRDRTRIQIAVASLAWREALRGPERGACARAALRHSAGVAHVIASGRVGR
jgi:glycosyltransferase involved in cell wall biosynthesis